MKSIPLELADYQVMLNNYWRPGEKGRLEEKRDEISVEKSRRTRIFLKECKKQFLIVMNTFEAMTKIFCLVIFI